MSFFKWLFNWWHGKKSDEQILTDICSVISAEMSEESSIHQQVEQLRQNWKVYDSEQKLKSWTRIHQLIKVHEARERVLEELETQLTKSEKDSILAKVKQESAQLK